MLIVLFLKQMIQGRNIIIVTHTLTAQQQTKKRHFHFYDSSYNTYRTYYRYI